MVEGDSQVFKVFFPEQRSTAPQFSEERMSERIVEQIVDISVSGGGLHGFRPGQSSSASFSSPAGVHEDANEPGVGVFELFPKIKKSAASATPSSLLLPSPRVHASVSSSTPAPLLRLDAWVMVLTGGGPYFWNRRTGETRWKMEDGLLPRWWLRPDGHHVCLDDM